MGNIGKVVQIIGPVVDVEFEDDQRTRAFGRALDHIIVATAQVAGVPGQVWVGQRRGSVGG